MTSYGSHLMANEVVANEEFVKDSYAQNTSSNYIATAPPTADDTYDIDISAKELKAHGILEYQYAAPGTDKVFNTMTFTIAASYKDVICFFDVFTDSTTGSVAAAAQEVITVKSPAPSEYADDTSVYVVNRVSARGTAGEAIGACRILVRPVYRKVINFP